MAENLLTWKRSARELAAEGFFAHPYHSWNEASTKHKWV